MLLRHVAFGTAVLYAFLAALQLSKIGLAVVHQRGSSVLANIPPSYGHLLWNYRLYPIDDLRWALTAWIIYLGVAHAAGANESPEREVATDRFVGDGAN